MKKLLQVVVGLITMAALVAMPVGWARNIYFLANDCDFAATSSNTCEVVRIIGVPLVPVGIVVGYMDLGD